jgi:hypothetical protein
VSRVYSQRLIVYRDLTTGATPVGGPPDNTQWVVRHVTATPEIDVAGPFEGFSLTIDALYPLWTLGGFMLATNQSYDWSGRHVLYAGEQLVFTTVTTGGPGWSLVVSGFELATP